MFYASIFGLWFVFFPPSTIKPYYPCGDGVQAQDTTGSGPLRARRPQATPPGCRR